MSVVRFRPGAPAPIKPDVSCQIVERSHSWSSALASKASEGNTSVGSNPTLSATPLAQTAWEIFSKAGSLTPSELQLLSPDDWLRVSLIYFRSLGFFSAQANLDVEALAQQILATRGRPFSPSGPLVDLDLLSYDLSAVWSADMEDCGEKPGFYAGAVTGWGHISRGVLEPTEISEDFGHVDGKPTLVWFRNHGKRFVVIADHTDESQWGIWLDLSVFDQLNIIIESSGRQYVIYKHPYQDASVLCLTPEEQQSLKYHRGWKFQFDPYDDEDEDAFFARFGIA